MVLNYIWIAFFLIAFLVALIRTIGGDNTIFGSIVDATFNSAELSFEISIGLVGVLCLWMGILKIGENGGAINVMSKVINPFFSKLFPEVPENHPARGSMLMNFAANMLGLDNAATPAGLKAMTELQELNPIKDTASNAQIMFLVLNTSGLTLIPVTIMNYRHTFGASNPSDVFLPILISTFCASLFGLIVTSIYQKINLFNKTILLYLGAMSIIVFGMLAYFSQLDTEQLKIQSSLLSNIILYGLICGFIVMAMLKKVNVYDSFIEGAKGGFEIAVKIIPFLVAILVSIAVFKASGAMDYLSLGMQWVFGLFLEDTTFVDAIPTALMRPLSGSGARGMMLSSWSEFGVDSFVGRLTATMQGATDTTFYIVAVYFGSVAIKNTRYAIKVGLLADLGGVIASVIVCSMFFKTEEVHLTKNEMASEIVNVWNDKNSKLEDKTLDFLSEDIVFIDQSYDTIAKGKEAFINFESINSDSISLEKIIEVDEVVYIKTQNGKNSYKVLFDKGKVVEVMYQGNYVNQ